MFLIQTDNQWKINKLMFNRQYLLTNKVTQLPKKIHVLYIT